MYGPKYNWKAENMVVKGMTTKTNIEEIKKWVDQHPNIPKLSDEQVVLFLSACDNDVQFTTVTIKAYFKYKYAAPEFFTDRFLDNEGVKQMIDNLYISVMPKRTKENYALVQSMLKDTSHWNFHLVPSTKILFMCLDVALYDTPADGLVILFDMTGIGLMHLTRIKLGAVRKFFNFLQEGLCCKLKAIHIFNCTYLFDKILTIIKPFMKKEVMELLLPHPVDYDMNEFYEKYVGRDCLPEDYGGTLPPISMLAKQTAEKFGKMRQYFEDDENQTKLYKKEK